MDKKEAIRLKIKALLAKTTENGATESEAIAALNKAQQLMLDYLISENELTAPYSSEKCVAETIARIKSGYDLTVFLGSLSHLFNCEHFYTAEAITFFGFKEDTELCAYFYNFIIKACFAEKAKYVQSVEYQRIARVYHGRTLVASFIRGFLSGICAKMRDMYECRNKNLTDKACLMVIEKEKKVKTQFAASGHNPRLVKSRDGEYVTRAYLDGEDRGKNTTIVQAVTEDDRKKTCVIPATAGV